jgi:hypothetical protein
MFMLYMFRLHRVIFRQHHQNIYWYCCIIDGGTLKVIREVYYNTCGNRFSRNIFSLFDVYVTVDICNSIIMNNNRRSYKITRWELYIMAVCYSYSPVNRYCHNTQFYVSCYLPQRFAVTLRQLLRHICRALNISRTLQAALLVPLGNTEWFPPEVLHSFLVWTSCTLCFLRFEWCSLHVAAIRAASLSRV